MVLALAKKEEEVTIECIENTMVALQGQVAKMNKLLKSMALSQVNVVGSSVHMV